MSDSERQFSTELRKVSTSPVANSSHDSGEPIWRRIGTRWVQLPDDRMRVRQSDEERARRFQESQAKHLASLKARLWAKVVITETCHVWTGATHNGGYGTINAGYGTRRTHRLVWEWANGPIPPGMYICHRCDNPPCVRLDHLFIGTSSDNARDRVAKGHQRGGRFGPRPRRKTLAQGPK